MMSATGASRLVARVPRFWVFYAIAWLPYWAIVLLAFVTSGELPFAAALPASLINVVPSAALGVLAIRLCRRLPWTPERPVRFFSVQLGLAAAYAVLAVFVESGLFVAHDSMQKGHFSRERGNPAIAVWHLLMAALIYCVLASVTYTLETLSRLRREEARVVRAKALQTEAELRALRAQLNQPDC